MAESPFSFLSDDVVLKIFFHLSDDPRHWARLSCVCQKFSSLISAVCCKSVCLSAVPSAALSAAFPGGWAALHKLAVCCPGLLHSGVLLDNSDFGLHRELSSSGDDHHDLHPPPTPIAAVETAVEVVEEEKYGGWSLYDDLYFDTVYNHEESDQYETGSVRNDDIAPAPTPMDIVTSIETGAAIVQNNHNPVGNGHLQNPSETPNDHIALVNTVGNGHLQNPPPRNDHIAPTQFPMTSTESSRSDHTTPTPSDVNPVGNGHLQYPHARNDHNTPPPAAMTTQTGASVVHNINSVGNGHLQNPPEPAQNDHNTPPPAAMTSVQTGASIVNSNDNPVGNGHLQNPPTRNDHIAPPPAAMTSIQTGASVVNSDNHHHRHPDRKSPAPIPNEPYNTTTKKRRLLTSSEGAHLAAGGWTLSREQGNKLLASRFRGDSLYLCDWPGCVHPRGKRNYMLFRGFFGNFKKSGVWRAIKDAGRARVEVDCAFCRCTETWDLHAAFCLRRGFGFHDDGEPVVRAYVCENGHVAGAWTDLPVYF